MIFLTKNEGVRNIWGVLFINTLSLFHFFRNSQQPENGSVSFASFGTEVQLQKGIFRNSF